MYLAPFGAIGSLGPAVPCPKAIRTRSAILNVRSEVFQAGQFQSSVLNFPAKATVRCLRGGSRADRAAVRKWEADVPERTAGQARTSVLSYPNFSNRRSLRNSWLPGMLLANQGRQNPFSGDDL